MTGNYKCLLTRHWYSNGPIFTLIRRNTSEKKDTISTGCPKKTLVSVQRLLEALKSELQMKVR